MEAIWAQISDMEALKPARKPPTQRTMFFRFSGEGKGQSAGKGERKGKGKGEGEGKREREGKGERKGNGGKEDVKGIERVRLPCRCGRVWHACFVCAERVECCPECRGVEFAYLFSGPRLGDCSFCLQEEWKRFPQALPWKQFPPYAVARGLWQ